MILWEDSCDKWVWFWLESDQGHLWVIPICPPPATNPTPDAQCWTPSMIKHSSTVHPPDVLSKGKPATQIHSVITKGSMCQGNVLHIPLCHTVCVCSTVQSKAVKTHKWWHREHNWLHRYSSTEKKQSRFIRETMRFCLIFSHGWEIHHMYRHTDDIRLYRYYLDYLK